MAQLLDISEKRATGVLHVRGGSATTRIYLLHGEPVFAEGGHYPDDFGAVLHEEGLLNRAQVMYLLSTVRKELDRDPGLRMGNAAIAMGFLSPVAVSEGLRIRTRRKILECFRPDKPSCIFESMAHLPAGIPRQPIALAPLLVAGVREIYDPIRIARVTRSHHGQYAWLRDAVGTVAERLELTAEDAQHLRALDGRRTIDEHLAAGKNIAGLIAALILLDEFETSERPRERSTRDERINSDRVPIARPWREPPSTDRRLGKSTRSGALRTARSSPLLRRARRLLIDGAYAAALRELERVRAAHPNLEETELLLAWARYRVGWPSRGGDEGLRLKELAIDHLAHQGFDPFACYALGHLQLGPDDEIRVFEILAEVMAGDRDR